MATKRSPGMLQRVWEIPFHTYLTIAIPDGLLLYMYGPVEVLRHIMKSYRESNLDSLLEIELHITEEQNYVYGDYSFVRRPCL